MDYMKNLLNISVKLANETTELMYQQKNELGLSKLNELIDILSQIINYLIQEKAKGTIIVIDESELLNIITNALKALEVKDMILLSDILKYDLINILAQISEKL